MTEHLDWIVPVVALILAGVLPMSITYIVNKAISKRLYDDKGLPIFVPRGECSTAQSRCTRTMCLKMEEVKAVVADVKKDLKTNRNMLVEMINSITQTLHEHDEKREIAREDYFKLGNQVVALETKTTILAQAAEEIKTNAKRLKDGNHV